MRRPEIPLIVFLGLMAAGIWLVIALPHSPQGGWICGSKESGAECLRQWASALSGYMALIAAYVAWLGIRLQLRHQRAAAKQDRQQFRLTSATAAAKLLGDRVQDLEEERSRVAAIGRFDQTEIIPMLEPLHKRRSGKITYPRETIAEHERKTRELADKMDEAAEYLIERGRRVSHSESLNTARLELAQACHGLGGKLRQFAHYTQDTQDVPYLEDVSAQILPPAARVAVSAAALRGSIELLLAQLRARVTELEMSILEK